LFRIFCLSRSRDEKEENEEKEEKFDLT